MCPKIQITAKGIRSALKKYTPYHSLAEYIWNGFDAKASEIKISYSADALGNIDSVTIEDNGYGIPHSKLQEKFEPLFESKKALENKLKKNQSALHGKNGIGRLTFFTFARNAVWRTTYKQNNQNLTYDIYANADNINFYTGINAIPKTTELGTGTAAIFTGIHSITSSNLEEKFREFLLKEFAWFLALNEKRNFFISINDVKLDYSSIISQSEEFQILHDKSETNFFLTYIQWSEKSSNEPSRYYYLDSENKERWKEATAIKNKGEQFYHSVFIQSPYFDSFSFQGKPTENQEALFSGNRSDAQFKFLRKKLANFLRIKRRPFLKSFAQDLLSQYGQQNIIPEEKSDKLEPTIKTLYEMQPRFFAALNTEQKKLLIGCLDIILKSNNLEQIPILLAKIVDLTEEEKQEIKSLFI